MQMAGTSISLASKEKWTPIPKTAFDVSRDREEARTAPRFTTYQRLLPRWMKHSTPSYIQKFQHRTRAPGFDSDKVIIF